MDMQINADRIRELRKKQGWIQEQLARVASLGIRTVHRIENEGIASPESIMAIASALSVTVEMLLIDKNEECTGKNKNFQVMELYVRLGLAIVSGLMVSVLLNWTVNYAHPYSSLPSFVSEIVYFLCGCLFGLFVACPFLTKSDLFNWRGLGLLVSCGVSFYSALYVYFYSLDEVFGENVKSFMLASFDGSLVILIGLRIFNRMKLPAITWILTTITSLFSGAYMYMAIYVLADYEFIALASIFGFCLWHSLLASILFHGTQKADSGQDGDTVLSPLIRWLLSKLGSRAEKVLKLFALKQIPIAQTS